jgi:hypothetical protein
MSNSKFTVKKKGLKKPKLGTEVALISQRNRIFKDRRKEENKLRCRKKNNE